MRTWCWFRSRSLVLLVLGSIAFGNPAAAVIIDSGDGTGNTTPPPDDPGWDNIGTRNGLTVVYLRNGWVITAAHVGIGDVVLDGAMYSAVAGSDIQLDNGDGTFADLLVYAVTPIPPLPELVVRSNPNQPTGEVIMAGKGRARGIASDSGDPGIWDPGVGPPPVPPKEGWYWAGSGPVRWGTNTVEGSGFYNNTESFLTVFDEPTSPSHTAHECQAANGDSGGPMFAKIGPNWELAGIIWAISGPAAQIPNTSALRENLTLVSDLSFYVDDINAITATPVPEPMVVAQLLLGGGALAFLKRLKRQRAGGRIRR